MVVSRKTNRWSPAEVVFEVQVSIGGALRVSPPNPETSFDRYSHRLECVCLLTSRNCFKCPWVCTCFLNDEGSSNVYGLCDLSFHKRVISQNKHGKEFSSFDPSLPLGWDWESLLTQDTGLQEDTTDLPTEYPSACEPTPLPPGPPSSPSLEGRIPFTVLYKPRFSHGELLVGVNNYLVGRCGHVTESTPSLKGTIRFFPP